LRVQQWKRHPPSAALGWGASKTFVFQKGRLLQILDFGDLADETDFDFCALYHMLVTG
jgi:hypothetical protein